MAYNSHGKRIRSENLAGQVTTTAWDQFACTSVDELISAAKNAKSAKHAYAYDAAGRRISCAHSGLAFTSPDTNAYLYNTRSELTNATAAVDSAYRYTYDFDDIGNRKTSSERGTNSVYTASQLNQYTAVDDFTPTYDADGNETLVKTATGIWNVTYNGENRPVRWELVSSNSNTPNSNTQTLLRMSFDRKGRRVTKNDQRFVYNGYLQICNYNSSTSTSHFNYYIWDPTEPVATRPLAWKRGTSVAYYTHDGNKNVSEVIASNNDVAAHYEYAPFGALTVLRGASAAANPWRFSSEYAEDDTATVYYNYRHYEPVMGRWMSRDSMGEKFSILLLGYLDNNSICDCDLQGGKSWWLFDDIVRRIKEAYDKVKSAYDAYSQCIDTTFDWVTTNRSKNLALVNDKMQHCWASCEIGEDCGAKFSVFVGVVKEFGDLMGAYSALFEDSINMFVGDFSFANYEWELDDSFADEDADMWGVECMKNGEDCECCCSARYSKQ